MQHRRVLVWQLDEASNAILTRLKHSTGTKMQDTYVNPAERKAYEDSLKYYRALKNVTDTAWGERP
ncbi:MAG: hypothetical protein CSB47_04605 [Proteobacteria bacterium]|nr:MAG: hypothetical protein CSB47_04605 [Pseudomonadota bacterium]